MTLHVFSSDDEDAVAHPFVGEIERFEKAAERFKAAAQRARADRTGTISQPITTLLSHLKSLKGEFGGVIEANRGQRESAGGHVGRAPQWRRESASKQKIKAPDWRRRESTGE